MFNVLGINLAIKVLQAGAWPLGPTQTLITFAVPQEFERSISMVSIFKIIRASNSTNSLTIFFTNSLKNFIQQILMDEN